MDRVKAVARPAPSPEDAELIDEFVEDCALRGMTPASIRRYRGAVADVASFLASTGRSVRDLDNETLKVVLKHLRSRKLAHKTLKNVFSALSSLADFLVYNGYADRNAVLPFRKRYLRSYKDNSSAERRKCISVEEMRMLIDAILDPRDKAVVTLLAKTGVRREELVAMDVDDVDWREQSIRLKPHPKRTNLLVYFDDEAARILRAWLRARESYRLTPGCRALFVGEGGDRLKRGGVYGAVTKHAGRLGLHDPKGRRLEDRFSPHNLRHWFTTVLRRNGMRRELIQELRGDARTAAVDLYDHIDPDELRRAYRAAMPTLGVG